MQADERASAAARHELVISVRRNGQVLFSPASAGRPATGTRLLRWPPIVSDAGVLLRRTMEDARDEAGRVHWGTETLTPWFVRRDGTVEELSFELGVSPLCVLPDGRYLLPGADPLWRDSFNRAAQRAGAGRQARVAHRRGGASLGATPRARRRPRWHVAREERQDEWTGSSRIPGETDAARVDDATGQLRIRLVDDRTVDGALRWIVVDVAARRRCSVGARRPRRDAGRRPRRPSRSVSDRAALASFARWTTRQNARASIVLRTPKPTSRCPRPSLIRNFSIIAHTSTTASRRSPTASSR